MADGCLCLLFTVFCIFLFSRSSFLTLVEEASDEENTARIKAEAEAAAAAAATAELKEVWGWVLKGAHVFFFL